MTSELLTQLGATDAGDQIRAAHERLDKTRCVGWLRATGFRPVSTVGIVAEGDRLPTSPQQVRRTARPRLEEACDMHPVEP